MANQPTNRPQGDTEMPVENGDPLDPVNQAIKIERLGGRIGSLETTLRAGVDALTAGNADMKETFRLWRAEYERQRDDWRRDHEDSNRESHSLLGAEIRQVRESLIRSIGIGCGFGLLGGVLVTGFFYTLNYRFEDQAGDVQRVERAVEKNEIQIGRTATDVDDIKLYLANGGRVPETPYNPNQRQQTDDKRNESQPAK